MSDKKSHIIEHNYHFNDSFRMTRKKNTTCLHHWLFARVIHRSSVDYPHKVAITRVRVLASTWWQISSVHTQVTQQKTRDYIYQHNTFVSGALNPNVTHGRITPSQYMQWMWRGAYFALRKCLQGYITVTSRAWALRHLQFRQPDGLLDNFFKLTTKNSKIIKNKHCWHFVRNIIFCVVFPRHEI